MASNKEFVVYDGFSLVAEVGGYMGLFLGWSTLSMAKAALEWAYGRRRKGKRRI